jgi:O-antigen/teichoic acid export membrane protein
VVTPLLLDGLGAAAYGTWVVILQVVTQLSLLDLGVTPVLSRRVAHAEGADDEGAAARSVGAASRLLLAQQGVLVLGSIALVAFAPDTWDGPALVVLVSGAVLTFPLRAFAGLLRGKQDFQFVSLSSMAGWCVQTVLAVVLVLTGHGLSSLAVAWSAGQLVTVALDAWRVTRRHGSLLGRLREHPSRLEVVSLWREGGWVSLNRLLQSGARGIDVVLVDRILGGAFVASYAMTSRPALIGQSFVLLALPFLAPGLAQLRGSQNRVGIQRAISAVLSGMLVLQGAVATVVLTCAEEFVRLWVGPELFAGRDVLVAGLLATTCVAFAAPLSAALFAVGLERRTVVANATEAAAFLGLAAILSPSLGLASLGLASASAIVIGRLPWVLAALSRELDSLSTTVWRPLVRWALRAAIPIAFGALLGPYVVGHGWVALVVAGLGSLLFYAACLWREVRAGPLQPYCEQLLVGLSGR